MFIYTPHRSTDLFLELKAVTPFPVSEQHFDYIILSMLDLVCSSWVRGQKKEFSTFVQDGFHLTYKLNLKSWYFMS